MGRKLAPKVQSYKKADGTYSYRVRIRVNGRQTTETFDSRAAAEAFCEQVTDPSVGVDEAVKNRDALDKHSPAYVPTMIEMLSRHIENLTGVDPRTKRDYRSVAEHSWLPMMRNLPVTAITRAHVARWVNEQDGQSAPKTIKNAHSLLSAVLTSAVRDEHIAANPASGTRLPRAGEEDVEELRFLTHAEFDRLHWAMPPYWQPFVVTLFGTGFRYSEATALQARDIDLENGTVRVVRAWKDGMKRTGPPKSKKSRRTIDIDETTARALARARALFSTDLVFTGPNGGQVWHGPFYGRKWTPACKAAGLEPRPRIHDARHTHASWLISEGVRLEAIQDRLGHEDISTTRKIYGHLMPEVRAESARAAGAAFARTSLASGKPIPEITARP